MSYIAGIDFSTRAVDVVLIDEDTGEPTWHPYPLAGMGDAFDRTRSVRTAMPPRSTWDDLGVIAIGIEQPRGNHGVTPLFRIQGAILACLPTQVLITPWNPSSWRLAVGLKGNATKIEVFEYVADLVSDARNTWPQDAADAYCIALATRDALERLEAA